MNSPYASIIAVVVLAAASPATSAVSLISGYDFLADYVVTSSHDFPYPQPDLNYGDGVPAPSPLIFSDVTISAPRGLEYYGDVGDYIGGIGGLTIVAKRAYAIAFDYDAYYGGTNITLTVEGQTFNLGPPGGFVAVTSDHPIGPVTFGGGGGGENDLYNIYLSAVPEPTIWTAMVIGFGLIGSTARGRKIKPALPV